MSLKNFKDLIVWQESMVLAREIYHLVKLLPNEERYGLSDQMRRAAVSIPSNIAEGQARNSTKEFIQFLHIAKGSNAELMTQLMLCSDFEYLTNEQTLNARELSNKIGKLLSGLIQSLKQKNC
ncbi:MAG: four helix bundle protein [Megasphaera sp.]|uniref:four helix bundle protein n=1 Tax=Acidaminococcus sp. TaxID=1872103 RepID=UPI0039BF4174|nr:four helix bundle protein [Megasphaera sp.]